jgi:hypothetical protein
MNEISYSRVSDYDLPNLTLPEHKDVFVGKYGLLRKAYLKSHRRVIYTNLLTSGKLQEHLAEIDSMANDRFETMVNQAVKAQNITEVLKASDQMAWVSAMNNIKNQAEEVVFKELIYV